MSRTISIHEATKCCCRKPSTSFAKYGLDWTPPTLNKDTPFDEAGPVIAELTEVIMELEDRLDVDLDLDTVDAAEQLKTVGDVVGALDAIVKARLTGSMTRPRIVITAWAAFAAWVRLQQKSGQA